MPRNASAARKSAPDEETPSAEEIAAEIGSAVADEKVIPLKPKASKKRHRKPFVARQKRVLLELRDTLVDTMAGVAKDTLWSQPEGSEASAFGEHQADAGSDTASRDLALSLLSQEQDVLYEIEEALVRIEEGTYGICEVSKELIPETRLEAIPFARLTVQCQAKLERESRGNGFARAQGPIFRQAERSARGL